MTTRVICVFLNYAIRQSHEIVMISSGNELKNLLNIQADFPQRIPQYIAAPQNIEAKRIISCFFAVLSF
jgi:hypothetical protein